MGKNEAGTIIHPDWYAAIDEMTADEARLFTKNLINRARGAKEIEVPEKIRFLLLAAYESVDRNLEKYKETSEKRSKAGRIGGQKSGESRRQKKADAESQTVGETQQKPSYDIDIFTEAAMNRSLEDCR